MLSTRYVSAVRPRRACYSPVMCAVFAHSVRVITSFERVFSERGIPSPHYSAYGVTSQIIWVEVTSRHLFLAITLPQFGAKPGFSRATGAPLRLFLKLDEFRWVAEVS